MDKYKATIHRVEPQIQVSMALLGLIYFVAFATEVLGSPDSLEQQLSAGAQNAIWLVFVIELLLRFLASEDKKRFLWANALEIVAITLPVLRAFRVLRLMLVFRWLSPFFKTRFQRTGIYLAFLVPLTCVTGALAILDVERDSEGARISSFADALWWSLATVTTIGDNNFYPVTQTGRVVAGALMVAGISLFSAGAGMFASWLQGGLHEKPRS